MSITYFVDSRYASPSSDGVRRGRT